MNLKVSFSGQNILDAHVNHHVQIAGWLIAGKTIRARHGDAMKFLTFEDETDRIETTFFHRNYQRYCLLLGFGRPYLLRGRVESDLGAISLNVHAIEPIGVTDIAHLAMKFLIEFGND